MRVLWVGHNLAYPPVRGVLLRNYNLLREAARNSEVHVLAFDQPRARPPGVSAEDCANALRQFCARVEWLPLAGSGSKNPYWLGLRGLLSRDAYDLHWFSSDAMVHRLQRTLAQMKFDAVHFDTLGLAPYRRFVSAAGTVLNHHNVESSMMLQRAENDTRRIPRQYWRWEAQKLLCAEREYCPQFALNLVVSPEDGATLAGHAPDITTRVVANGVDTGYFTPRADPGGNTLLFCGGLDWYPNGDAMVYFFDQIWPLVVRQTPQVRMIVVGRNPPRWLTRLGETDRRIQVTGFVDDVRPYFGEATVYVCPIRSGGGTRLKILDALAMGMPLVGTTFACSGISLQHEKQVLLADTPAAFAEQVARALADPGLRANLAARGRDLVCQDYSWSVVGRNLLLAYEEAASSADRKPRPLFSGGRR